MGMVYRFGNVGDSKRPRLKLAESAVGGERRCRGPGNCQIRKVDEKSTFDPVSLIGPIRFCGWPCRSDVPHPDRTIAIHIFDVVMCSCRTFRLPPTSTGRQGAHTG